MFGKQRLITVAVTLAAVALVNRVPVFAPVKKLINGGE